MLNIGEIERLAGLGAEHDTIAYVLGISPSALSAYCKADPDIATAMTRGLSSMKVMLRDKQLEKAKRGDTKMLIWLGKQFLGQAEKINEKIDIESTTRAIEAAEKAVQKNPNLLGELFPDLEMESIH